MRDLELKWVLFLGLVFLHLCYNSFRYVIETLIRLEICYALERKPDVQIASTN